MAPTIDDRLLWVGLGAFTLIAIKYVSNGLREVRTLTRISHPTLLPPPPHRSLHTSNVNVPPTSQEDAIKTSSLLALATCHNTEIRKAATQILCTRFFANKSARKLLIRDLESTDEEARRSAHLALGLLYEHGMVQEYNVPPPTPRAHRARERDRERGDAAERDLRRRRREAMVINEGDRPISQEDVYMRDQEGQMRARGPDV